MSALGQKRTFGHVRAMSALVPTMSALTPIADIHTVFENVRFGPGSGHCRFSPIERRFCPRVSKKTFLASASQNFLPWIVNVARLNIAKASTYRPRRRHHVANCCIVRVGRARV
jgi:hypothetical protein